MNSDLIKLAIDAKKASYSPYSKFRVGAALLTKSGKIFTGANIENAAYGPSVCAERVAVFKAVNDGEMDFVEIAVCGTGDDYAYPCGVCRQVLNEFSPDIIVTVCSENGKSNSIKLSDLLPNSFGPKNLI